MPSPYTTGKVILADKILSDLPDCLSTLPMVSIESVGTGQTYDLYVLLYLPNDAQPVMNPDFNTVTTFGTTAGDMLVRVINISFSSKILNSWGLWKFKAEYTVDGPGAVGIYVNLTGNGLEVPRTARGTVTTVATS